MAKFSEKKMGKEVGNAGVYANPHTMSGGPVKAEVKNQSGSNYMSEMNIAGGVVSKGNYKPTKTDGITMRGAGAATKGTKCRGPMA